MPAQELVFAVRTANPSALHTLTDQVRKLAGDMGIEVLGVDVADVWAPPAVDSAREPAFNNNRVVDTADGR